MKNLPQITSRFDIKLIAGALALIAQLSAMAADADLAAVVQVKVFPDQYVVNEQRFANAVALEASLAPAGGRMLRLEHCGQGADRALFAAVERLHFAHVGWMEIRALPGGSPECSPVTENAIGKDASGVLSGDPAYLATDSFGRSIIP